MGGNTGPSKQENWTIIWVVADERGYNAGFYRYH
jgi:hypothetical protein